MKTRPKSEETLEDIVFSKRNKEYGAYYLGKKYRKYTLVSLIIAVFLICGAIVYPVVASYFKIGSIIGSEVEIIFRPMPPPDVEKPVLPEIPEPPALERTAVFRVPVVAEDDSIDNGLGTTDEINSTVVNAAPPTDAPIDIPEEPVTRVIEEPVVETPVPWVPEMPEFTGGEEARIRFIKENMRFPEEAFQMGVQGKVYITFVVEKDGSITDVRLKRGIGGGCDEEAIRVVKMMPKWKPGKNNGHPVRVQFIMDVKFTIAG